ncbi:MAG: PEP-CTERM system histidine kinase PrsK [Gammaproteobacteria bacterium]|nr:PEP-CTERM system histidine kinase PrsK [Gammaproteobacteria bacterium]
MNVGLYSYLGAGIAYSFFAALLLFSWRESLQGKLLFIAVFINACWSLIAAQIALHDESYLLPYLSFEIFRYIAWYVFLLKLFDVASLNNQSRSTKKNDSYQMFIHWALPLSVGFALLLLLNEVIAGVFSLPGQYTLGVAGNVLLALIGIAIVEQLYRNTAAHYRWAIKYLFLGIGGMFAFDFYLYADALLFRSVDQNVWTARGIVHIVAIPLLAISSVRNKNWSLNIFVSRDVVLNTTAILIGGLYLLAMAGAGYYLREFGGDWGHIGQVMLLALAVVFLFAIATSSQVRAKARVFLVKNFYKNRYDYRIEWLRLTDDLNENIQHKNYNLTAIEAIAHIVDARAGLLWLRDKGGGYENVYTLQCKRADYLIDNDSSLVSFLEQKRFVINLRELESHAGEYNGLILPGWMTMDESLWLIIPLHGEDVLQGFIVLANPLVERSINWEDRDLLKTAAKQITSYLTALRISSELAEAKQFEVFTRLSAYMVHDLKNIAAELELIAINAKKHANNPEFINDAFATAEHAAGDINRLLVQLRNRRANTEKKVRVNLVTLIAEVVATKQHIKPSPQLKVLTDSSMALLEKKRFTNVLAHLIENAQQATQENGEITIALSVNKKMHLVEIQDTGHGMSDDFIRNRLFTPFDTTKGNAGMGIGMYESREFIRHLGGDISVKSKPEKGTIIILQVPADSPQ